MPSKLKRLKENKHMLYVLKGASPQMRKSILKLAPSEVIEAIHEIAYNILSGGYPVNLRSKSALQKYKSQIRNLVYPSRSLTAKRKVLIQSGGSFLPLILSIILNGVIGKILEKNE